MSFEVGAIELLAPPLPALLSENVNPKVVSEMLGYATIAITLATCSHVLPTMQESAAKAIKRPYRSLLLPKPPTATPEATLCSRI